MYTPSRRIDWSGQIKALQKDQYSGFISVETHMQPKIRSANDALQRLRQLLESTHELQEENLSHPSF
jgi:sugar phosphate isomerase/epimerase